MKEVNFIDTNWQRSIDLLFNGESVFLCAPEHYGKKTFLQYIRESGIFEGEYTIISINNIKDSKEIDFQNILDQFQNSATTGKHLLASNPYEFIYSLEFLVKENSFLVLVANSLRSYKNVSILLDTFHEIILRYPNGYKKNLTVMLTDDYSMYYYEHERTSSNSASPWFFFKKIHIHHLTETSIIEERLLNFFHNKQLVDSIVKSLIKLSGGHQGIIIETINYLLEKWKSIDFNNIDKEIEVNISSSRFIDSLRQDFSVLTAEELKYLATFENKKLIEAYQNNLIRRFYIKGVLVKKGDLHIELSQGVIRNLFTKIHNAKVMQEHEKLILCIHGLAGSEETWANFHELYLADDTLKQEYDFSVYTFPTSMWWNFNFITAQDPPINQLADGLKTAIEYKFNDYSEIVLVCHSLGGLVGRKYLLEKYLGERHQNITNNKAPSINKIIMYATPHNGASLANVAKYITIRNKQVKQLCEHSDFIQELNSKWMSLGAHDHYKGWYVVGGKDQIVNKNSAELFWGNSRCQTVIDADHFTIVKPNTNKDLSYLIFKKVLLEDI